MRNGIGGNLVHFLKIFTLFDIWFICYCYFPKFARNSRETRANTKSQKSHGVRKVFSVAAVLRKMAKRYGDYFSSITIMTPPTRSCKPNAKKKQHVFLEVGLSSHLCVAGFPKYSFLFMHCDDTHQIFFWSTKCISKQGCFWRFIRRRVLYVCEFVKSQVLDQVQRHCSMQSPEARRLHPDATFGSAVPFHWLACGKVLNTSLLEKRVFLQILFPFYLQPTK